MFLFFLILGQMNHLPQKLRMRMSKEPVHIVCPHCQHNGMSYIEKKVGGIIICYGLMLALIWYAVFFSKLTSETIQKTLFCSGTYTCSKSCIQFCSVQNINDLRISKLCKFLKINLNSNFQQIGLI